MACDGMGYELDLFAVNHWDIAIATHSANHPHAKHMCASIDTVDPRIAVPGGRLDLLWASPECTFFSVARGGKPVTDQGRASAWLILRWAELLYIDTILIENVKEFRDWGPVGQNGKPLKSKKGQTFVAFLTALESFGYRTEWQIYNAADFGAATSRERLFIQARRGNKPLSWPRPTHHKNGGRLKKWRGAREIIDWEIPCPSIFSRKRPLSPTTMARIIAGLEKFGGKELEPFLVILRNHADGRSVDSPIPTLTAGGNHVGLARPFLSSYRGSHAGKADGSTRNHHSIDEPIRTLDTSNRYALVQPQPFVLAHRQFDESCVDSVERPLRTITDGTVSAKYCSTGGARSVEKPIDTITSRDRFALVTPLVHQLEDGTRVALDIGFRMLTPRELASAMSFPETYQFTGNREAIVKQIGNAVDGSMARALCEAVLA